jgi:hypothetical protein
VFSDHGKEKRLRPQSSLTDQAFGFGAAFLGFFVAGDFFTFGFAAFLAGLFATFGFAAAADLAFAGDLAAFFGFAAAGADFFGFAGDLVAFFGFAGDFFVFVAFFSPAGFGDLGAFFTAATFLPAAAFFLGAAAAFPIRNDPDAPFPFTWISDPLVTADFRYFLMCGASRSTSTVLWWAAIHFLMA